MSDYPNVPGLAENVARANHAVTRMVTGGGCVLLAALAGGAVSAGWYGTATFLGILALVAGGGFVAEGLR